MNKKGAETGNQLLVFPFIFLLVVIGVGIVIGVSIFFGNEYDYRLVDAEILNYKIESCLNSYGDIDMLNFESRCGVNISILNKSDIDFRVCKFDPVDSVLCFAKEYNNPDIILNVGSGFENCFLNKEGNEEYPICTNEVVSINGNMFEIIVKSNQHIRRISNE